MNRRTTFVSMLMLLSFNPSLHADELATTQSAGVVVGSVYGKPFTSTDIGLVRPIDADLKFDSRDTGNWELMGRITTTFGKPILDRFVEEKKIDATAEEIAAFNETMRKQYDKQVAEMEGELALVKADLGSKRLTDTEKTKLEQNQTMLEQVLPPMREAGKAGPRDAMARKMIVSWKIERELHRAFGGRVIFQQFGLEALDARRTLFEQAEKNGDLKFADAGVRHLFYYYSNMKHLAGDEKALERPWFLTDEK